MDFLYKNKKRRRTGKVVRHFDTSPGRQLSVLRLFWLAYCSGRQGFPTRLSRHRRSRCGLGGRSGNNFPVSPILQRVLRRLRATLLLRSICIDPLLFPSGDFLDWVNRYGIFDALLVGGGDDENENKYKNDSDGGRSIFHVLLVPFFLELRILYEYICKIAIGRAENTGLRYNKAYGTKNNRGELEGESKNGFGGGAAF